jgi:hypothetical protein
MTQNGRIECISLIVNRNPPQIGDVRIEAIIWGHTREYGPSSTAVGDQRINQPVLTRAASDGTLGIDGALYTYHSAARFPHVISSLARAASGSAMVRWMNRSR